MVSILDVLGFDKLPQLSRPKDIYTFMVATQTKAYGQSIELPYAVLVRNIKLLLKKYTAEEVVRGIFWATHYSDFPFSTAFVEELILQRKNDEACIAISNYKNILEDV